MKQLLLLFMLTLMPALVCADAIEDLTHSSGGMAFHMTPTNFNKNSQNIGSIIINENMPVKSNAKQQAMRNTLLWIANNIPCQPTTKMNFAVDSLLTHLWISVNATSGKPRVELISPGGLFYESHVLHAGFNTVITVAKPTPGGWTMQVNCTGNFAIQIKGASPDFIVDQRVVRNMLGHEGKDYFPYSGKLIPLLKEHFSVGLADRDHVFNHFNFATIADDGKFLDKATVADIQPGAAITYLRAQLQIPMQPFRILLFGTDKNGYPFQRMGSYIFKWDENRPKI